MTWVVGGNCFNGFICVADTQATIMTPGERNKYFNCVQKIHKVAKNLCIAFCGDIRTGLEIINELRLQLSMSIPAENYFDIDGYSKVIIKFLKENYNRLNPTFKPAVEFMFLWNAQEGDELQFRPFCMKFRAPDFNINSTPRIGLAKMGSGNNNDSFQAISSFLSGNTQSTAAFEKIFPGQSEASRFWTVEKFKNMIFHEASKVTFPGVSKTFISCESVIGFSDIFKEDTHKQLTECFKKLGVTYEKVETANHHFIKVTLDPQVITDTYKDMCQKDIKSLVSIRKTLRESEASIDMEPTHQLPTVEFKYIHGDEQVERPDLIADWNDMEIFLKKNKINISACQAVA